MDIREQPKLRFNGVSIINVQVNVLRQSIGAQKNIAINCTPRVFYPKDNSMAFNVIMDLELKSEGHFDLFVRAIGLFELSQEITDELKKMFVNGNAPAIMFPYLRSFVTTISANMGSSIGNITMPTQFFNGELEELEDISL